MQVGPTLISCSSDAWQVTSCKQGANIEAFLTSNSNKQACQHYCESIAWAPSMTTSYLQKSTSSHQEPQQRQPQRENYSWPMLVRGGQQAPATTTMATTSRRASIKATTTATALIQRRGVYWDKPKLRGEFHRWGAFLYPPLLGLPLLLRARGSSFAWKEALLFSLAVEGILAVSATLHTFPWRRETWHQVFRKMDFCMIFVGIALLYSSMGKLLFTATTSGLGSTAAASAVGNAAAGLGSSSQIFSSVIEPLVWSCAAVGILVKTTWPNAPPWLNALIFLVQGWACGPLLPNLPQTASRAEMTGLVAGGLFVTAGATAYSLQWPRPTAANRGRSEKGKRHHHKRHNHHHHHKPLHERVFGPHELFHVGTLGMFVAFWFSMFLRVTRG